jgi:Nif-specific regulatory protein
MAPLNILVVHGDPVRRSTLLAALQEGNLHPVEAGDPDRVASLLGSPMDALLLDLTLPGLDLGSLRQALFPPEPGEPESLEAAERQHLSRVLRHTAGNKRRAALILGISRSTLLHKVRKYHLEDG